ncbi:MAG TPA: response regulator, partial [Blastocatellia bacterium]|nr:response regulator [Blastocatellia bacterium]
ERAEQETALPAHDGLPGGNRILVVSAAQLLRRFIRRELSALGATADTATTGAEALDKLGKSALRGMPFDFVLVDPLSKCDAYSLAGGVRQDETISAVRLILLMPLRPALPEEEWRAAGFFNCLTMPITESSLLDGINGVNAEQQDDLRTKDDSAYRKRPHAPLAGSARGRILVAEDSPINQKVTRRQLQGLGYDADVVENGIEALDAIKTRHYDCILMDCQMPMMDGYAATEELRRLEGEQERTPVVALTASAMTSDRDRCLRAGMDDFIAKPTRQSELASVLRKWIGAASGCEAVSGDNGEHANLDRILAVFDLNSTSDRAEVVELIETFIRDTERSLEELSTAIDQTDLKKLQRVAHRTDGSCVNMGASYLAELAGQIQRAVADSPVESRTILENMRSEFSIVKGCLISEKARLGAMG